MTTTAQSVPAAPSSAGERPASSLRARLLQRIAAELPRATAFRRELHQHPELSFRESRTSQRICEELAALGVEHKAGYAKGTGVVAHLPATEQRSRLAPAVALRADMDALPITEATGASYASTTPGVMHACGHDGHTAMLLTCVRVLKDMPRPNPVTFVFQPAEENGGGGAYMADEGAIDGQGKGGLGIAAARIFGLHGWPALTVGHVSTRPGPIFASVDDFVITVRGTQAHAAYPHLGHDPILASAHIITALQSIASRSVNPIDSAVVTVGQINAGTANNIIPAHCTVIGTIRTLTANNRALAKARFYDIVQHTASAMGCNADIAWQDGYPVTVNDASLAESIADIAQRNLGPERYTHMANPTMGGEDFGYFSAKARACFFLLGLRPLGRDSFPSLHQPDFDFTDDAIPTGVDMLCAAALHEWPID